MYRDEDLRPAVFVQYLMGSHSPPGDMVRRLFLGQITEEKFMKFYMNRYENKERALVQAKRHVALVKRCQVFMSTGNDVIPEEIPW